MVFFSSMYIYLNKVLSNSILKSSKLIFTRYILVPAGNLKVEKPMLLFFFLNPTHIHSQKAFIIYMYANLFRYFWEIN